MHTVLSYIILGNSPPKFSNDTSAIFLRINASKQLHITAEDKDGDSVKFNVSGLPKGAIVRTNSSTIVVSWDVTMEKVGLSDLRLKVQDIHRIKR